MERVRKYEVAKWQKEWSEGFALGNANLPYNNPYDEDTIEHNVFFTGYDDGTIARSMREAIDTE